MAELTLYYSPGACSIGPHVALEESGLAFEVRPIDFATTEQRSPTFLAVNPKGRVPALVDGGVVVTEAPAILRYIARTAPGAALWPEDAVEEARCTEWMAWCSSTIHPAYAHVRRAERYATSDAARADVVAKGRETCLDLWTAMDRKLGRSTWAAGECYSVADAYLLFFFNLGRGAVLGYDMAADFPHLFAHSRRLGERPAVQRAIAREGLKPL